MLDLSLPDYLMPHTFMPVLFTFDTSFLCLLYLFTCLVSEVTFGVTCDNTFTTIQETEEVHQTSHRIAKWTPDDIV